MTGVRNDVRTVYKFVLWHKDICIVTESFYMYMVCSCAAINCWFRKSTAYEHEQKPYNVGV